jgi:hypothetical protein
MRVAARKMAEGVMARDFSAMVSTLAKAHSRVLVGRISRKPWHRH